jgi:hypothetical protein
MKIMIAVGIGVVCIVSCSEMEIAWTKKIDAAGSGNYHIAAIERMDTHTFLMGTYRPAPSSESQVFCAMLDSTDGIVWHILYKDPKQRPIRGRSMIVQREEEQLFDISYRVYLQAQVTHANGARATVLLSYHDDGTHAWSVEVPRRKGDDETHSMLCADHEGNMYVIGARTDPREQTRIFVITVSSEGEILTETQSEAITADNIKVDVAGPDGIVIAGSSKAHAEMFCLRYQGPDQGFTPITVPLFIDKPCLADVAITEEQEVYLLAAVQEQNSGYDYFTMCIDGSDCVVWKQVFNGPADLDDIPVVLNVDDSGCVYVTGTTETGSGVTDIMTVKYDSAGKEQWARRFVGKKGESARPCLLYPDKAIHGAAAHNIYIYGAVGNDGVIITYSNHGFLTWFHRITREQALCVPTAGSVHLVVMQAIAGEMQEALLVKFQRSEQIGLIRWD